MYTENGLVTQISNLIKLRKVYLWSTWNNQVANPMHIILYQIIGGSFVYSLLLEKCILMKTIASIKL